MWKPIPMKNAITLVWHKSNVSHVEHPLSTVNPKVYQLLTRRYGRPIGTVKDVTDYIWISEGVNTFEL